MRDYRSMASNGEHADTHAADTPGIIPFHFVTLKPRFVHREKHLSTVIQELLVSTKMSRIEIFSFNLSLQP